MAAKTKVEIFGLLNDISYVRARCCAEDLYKKNTDQFEEPMLVGMLQFDWDIFIDGKIKEFRGEMWKFKEHVLTFVDGELIGDADDFISWAEENHNFEEFRPMPLYVTLTDEGYKAHMNSKNHDFVFMDISIGGLSAGRLVIELYTDRVPKTCTNFKALCTGKEGISETTGIQLTYVGSIFHRIVRNGWIQGGDIHGGRGIGGESIYGPVFEDENFSVPHNRRGVLGMANRGRHTNQSQFYITLQPTAWMDTKYVAFGQIIEGTGTLNKMEEVQTMNERPKSIIKVTDSGQLGFYF